MKTLIILMADDDPDDRAFFCEAVNEINPSVICYDVENGMEALKLLQTKELRPDIIFLDINMPVMNGWECIQELKKDKRYRDIGVIMYSTSKNELDIKKAVSLGAMCLFTKPDDYKVIKEILASIIANFDGDLLKAIRDFPNIKF